VSAACGCGHHVPPDYCESGCCKSCAESARFKFTVGPGESFDMSDFTVGPRETPHGAREAVARAIAAIMCGEYCTQDGVVIPCQECVDDFLLDADAALAALAPIIAAEIRAWAETGLKGATRLQNSLNHDADAIASRICGGEA